MFCPFPSRSRVRVSRFEKETEKEYGLRVVSLKSVAVDASKFEGTGSRPVLRDMNIDEIEVLQSYILAKIMQRKKPDGDLFKTKFGFFTVAQVSSEFADMHTNRASIFRSTTMPQYWVDVASNMCLNDLIAFERIIWVEKRDLERRLLNTEDQSGIAWKRVPMIIREKGYAIVPMASLGVHRA